MIKTVFRSLGDNYQTNVKLYLFRVIYLLRRDLRSFETQSRGFDQGNTTETLRFNQNGVTNGGVESQVTVVLIVNQ